MRSRAYKFIIAKQPGNAESIQIEGMFDGTPEGWAADVEPLLAILDVRMHAQNMRVLRGAQKFNEVQPEAAAAAARILRLVNHVDLEKSAEELVAVTDDAVQAMS